ncbi:hypothetical protein [Hutsoniella sourekii]|uniref:hypothetical protein n=1 Tax=Hutsoniella sourekii TaxID=87650 RepID=UPI0004813ECC|nr:hypothetical protein [Hutsoniella sourekii]
MDWLTDKLLNDAREQSGWLTWGELQKFLLKKGHNPPKNISNFSHRLRKEGIKSYGRYGEGGPRKVRVLFDPENVQKDTVAILPYRLYVILKKQGFHNLEGELLKTAIDWALVRFAINEKKNELIEKTIIIQRDKLSGRIVGVYTSVEEASEISGVLKKRIQSCLTGHKKSSGGYTWERIIKEMENGR